MSTNIINPPTNLITDSNIIQDPNIIPKTEQSTNESLNTNTNSNANTNSKNKEAIPNSLIIYIKTRIPNFYKLTYEPFMSVPQSKSHTVYFDPLIKYYTWPIRDIPSQAPKNTILTQFFEATEFDTMINRILSDFRYMQKPRTLQQAFNEGIIDDNINLTLNTLFRPNNLFYLNKTPYTIVSKRWTTGAWDIDKKPIQKLLSQFSHLSAKQIEEQAKKEEDDIPESIRQGNLASESLAKKAMASYVATGLSDSAPKPNSNPVKDTSKKTFLAPAKAKSNLEYATSYIKKLFSKFLQDNPPINYSKTSTLLSDPLSLSLLIDPEQISKFISDNPDDPIVEIYDAFWTSKDNLFNADNEYKDTIIELNRIQASITASFEIFKDNIKDANLSKFDKQKVIKNIFKSKFDFMTCFFKLADLMNSIYELQKAYFESLKTLLEQFKKLYATIISYPGIPQLAIKCIDYDIESISVFLKKDPENKYSQSYFKNLEQFTQFYKNKLYKNKQQLLNPQFNYASELKKYVDNTLLLSIELDQFELYGFRMLLFYSYNQLDIWVSMFKSTQTFSTFIQIDASRTVEDANQYFQDYQKYINTNDSDKNYRVTFLQRLQVDGVKYEKDKWHLVKSDGSNCDIKTSQDKQQQELYIGLLKSKVESYDSIVLYIYTLEITCLRQHALYVAEENVNHLNFEHSVTLTQYYDKIFKSFNNNNISYIPESLFWDSNDLYSLSILNNKIKINKKSYLLFRQRLKSIPESREFLNKACEEIHDAIDPSIDSNDFLRFCNSIIKFNVPTIPAYTFRSSHWLEMDVANYDIVNTQDFLYNMSSVIKEVTMDFILHDKDINSSDYLDWMVFKNNESSEEDSLLAAVCNALNGQLNMDGNDSTNKYTEKIRASPSSNFTLGQNVEVQDIKQDIWLPAKIIKINKDGTYVVKYTDGQQESKIKKDKIRVPDDPNNDLIGKNRFTVSSLKKLIAENISSFPENTEHITILQSVLKIKFIVFEMYPRENPGNIREGDIVFYTNEDRSKRCRVVNIETVDGTSTYNLFDGENTYDNIPVSQIELSENNLTNSFRINCSPISDNEDLFIYLLVTENKEKQKKYELVINTTNNKYIYSANEIPLYIIYFLYNNCNQFLGNGYEKLDFEVIKDKIAHIQKDNELKRIEEQIMENLYDLHNRKIKSEFDHDEELKKQLLAEEIDDLENERKKLIPSEKYIKLSLDEDTKLDPLSGGAIKPSELYGDYANPYPSRYNSNYMSPDPYQQNAYQQNAYQQNPYELNSYPQPPYRQNFRPPGFNRPYRYPPYVYNRSYQLASNKAKDTKSKLAFYIEIELELFPGKTASMFQKSVIRCQSVFERIREAYADILGYQYRPGAMTDAYAYQYQTNRKK
jgi:hypothetical protein